MQKKKVMAILLSTAIAASTFIGCGADKAKDYKDADTVMFIDKDNKIDYATACTYTRMMQAETYSYMQSITCYQYRAQTDEPERDEKRDAAVVIQQGLPWIPRVLQMQRLTGVFCYQKKERKNSNKRIPISSWITIYQRKTGSPRPTKSRPRVKYSGFNFARGSESPFEVWLRAGTASYQLKRTISSTITKTTLSERPSGKKSAGTSR